MMKTCKVLYDDDKWHEGTITECEKCENVWKYKISFSDGDFTYATRDDPEVVSIITLTIVILITINHSAGFCATTRYHANLLIFMIT